MADNPISPDSEVPSSTVKRQPKRLASTKRHEKFKIDFSPELILTFPGLPGPVIKPYKDADEGDN
jgi:hypothetical protein